MDFSSPQAAAKAFDEKQSSEIDGRQILLDFSSPQGTYTKGFFKYSAFKCCNDEQVLNWIGGKY